MERIIYRLTMTLLAFFLVTLLVGALLVAFALWRRLAGRLRKYRKLFLASPHPVLLLDGFEVVDCNPAVQRVFGLEREQFIGSNLIEYSQAVQADGENSEDKLGNKLDAAADGDAQFFEWTHKRVDEIPFPAELGLAPVEFDGSQLYLAVIRDIHGQKRLEQQLRMTRDKLKKANQKLEEQAVFDGLTGVLNRRGFEQTLDEEWSRCRRKQEPLSLLIVDIDYFKKFNDSYGHIQGDECLKQVAEVIQENVRRAGDSVARYGGEEFAAILPRTPARGARRVAQNIRQAVKEARLEHRASPIDDFLTVSVGGHTVVPSGDQESSSLINSADKALYRAKDNGRDRVEVA